MIYISLEWMQGDGFIRHSLLVTKCFLDTIFKDKEF